MTQAPEHTCEHCLSTFSSWHKTPKYCSRSCYHTSRYRGLPGSQERSDYYRDRYLQKKYGISLSEYRQILDKQDGKCAICKVVAEEDHLKINDTIKRLYLDHCHETGKVRGILCAHCNSVLGYAKDNITVLKNAINYLGEHQ